VTPPGGQLTNGTRHSSQNSLWCVSWALRPTRFRQRRRMPLSSLATTRTRRRETSTLTRSVRCLPARPSFRMHDDDDDSRRCTRGNDVRIQDGGNTRPPAMVVYSRRPADGVQQAPRAPANCILSLEKTTTERGSRVDQLSGFIKTGSGEHKRKQIYWMSLHRGRLTDLYRWGVRWVADTDHGVTELEFHGLLLHACFDVEAVDGPL